MAFSRRPHEVAAGRAFLVEARHRDDADLPTYKEFAASYGGHQIAASPVLNSIARECAERGEPDLSVLVINADTRAPGKVAGEPFDRHDEAHQRRWREELSAVRRHRW